MSLTDTPFTATREQFITMGALAADRLVEPDAPTSNMEEAWQVEVQIDPDHGLVLRLRDIERDFYIGPDGTNPFTGEQYR